jgi:hypothetical protein
MFLPAVLTYFGVLNLSDSLVGVLGVTGLLGPILSGFIMTAVTEGREGIRRWLRRIARRRVGFQRSAAPRLGVLLQLIELLEGEAQVVDLVPKRQPNTSKYKAAGPTPRVRCPIVIIEPPGEAAWWKESPRYRTYRRRGLDKRYMYCT